MQTLPNESIEKQGSYAGFLPRLFAYFIDWIIVSIGVAIVKGIFLSGLEAWSFMTVDILFTYSVIDILTWMLKISYFVISLYCTQTTIGKYLMKLKVVGAEREKISLFSILYREVVGRFLSSFFYIGYLIIIADKEKAALHDKLADTRVVYSCNVKVAKKVIVTKVWNNQAGVQQAANADAQMSDTVADEVKQSMANEDDTVVAVNVEAEVVAVVPEEIIEEEIQAALNGKTESEDAVDVAMLVSEANQSITEEKEEEEEKKENEVI